MYKRKFTSVKEAYDYTASRIGLVKDGTALVNNYVRALKELGATKPVVVRKSYSADKYIAFNAEFDKVPKDTILIYEDGTVSV